MLLKLGHGVEGTYLPSDTQPKSCSASPPASCRPGEKLPTIRALAEQSGVNMMTVNKAYGILKQEGYITTDRRGGTVVSGSRGAGGP